MTKGVSLGCECLVVLCKNEKKHYQVNDIIVEYDVFVLSDMPSAFW